MNTINGNFIERTIPNTKNATIAINIGGVDATMSVSDFKLNPSALQIINNAPLDATLRAVTDGMGTSSLLNLSTEQVGVLRTVNLAAGATTPRLFNVEYTINNSGAQTGTLTGLFLNATETALNGITHNLMDLQVGGVSRLLFGSTNQLIVGGAGTNASVFLKRNDGQNLLSLDASGVIGTYQGQNMTFQINSVTQMFFSSNIASQFNYPIRLSGATSSFPMIKRNGAAIDFRLADDSDYCQITANGLQTIAATSGTYITFGAAATSGFITGGAGVLRIKSSGSLDMVNIFGNFVGIAETSIIPSALFAIGSTTRGFLPPRMTTAQINAIVTPANGLQVYNTDLAQPCFYDGTGWKKVSHTAM